MLFDSLREKVNDDKVTIVVGLISRMLPWMLDSVGYFDVKKNLAEKRGEMFPHVSGPITRPVRKVSCYFKQVFDLILKM